MKSMLLMLMSVLVIIFEMIIPIMIMRTWMTYMVIYRCSIDDLPMIYRWYIDDLSVIYRWHIHDTYSKIGPGAITGHQIGRIKMISIPTKTTSKNLLFATAKSWIWAVYDRFISKILYKLKQIEILNFFLSFYIDPGGQNSHPGGPGGDSGGQKHQKIDFFWKFDFLIRGPWKTL